MAGPAVVVIAALSTAWIAVSSSDGLVADDYYKKGLAVNQTLAQSEAAARAGLAAHVRMAENGVDLQLTSVDKNFTRPSSVVLTLSHPTRAGLDQVATLSKSGDHYMGAMRLPASGHWLVLLEDGNHTWRLLGKVVLPAEGETVIGGTSAEGK